MKSLLIILLTVEIIPLIIGIIGNWIVLPKGSTIKDLISGFDEWNNHKADAIPLIMYIIPGINIVLCFLIVINLIFSFFDMIFRKIKFDKLVDKYFTKFFSIRIK